MQKERVLERNILSIFSTLASTLGYSPIHGKIIGSLLMESKQLTLQEIAKKTGYSSGMISLSLDLLEVLGVVKKIKKTGDRKLYVRLEGDLLEILKKAVIVKVKNGIGDSIADLEEKKNDVMELPENQRSNMLNTLETLEAEIKRLESYVDLLSGIRLPSKD